MKVKYLFLILIGTIISSSPSFGEWTEFEMDSDGVNFIESDTIRKNGDLVYFNLVEDFFEPINQNRVLSEWKRVSINCKTKESTTFLVRQYSDSMGKGDLIVQYDFSDTTYKFQKGSFNHRLSKVVC